MSTSISESEPITSISISRDSNSLLVNLSSQKIHLWKLRYKKKYFENDDKASGVLKSFDISVSSTPDIKFYGLPEQKGEEVSGDD